MTKQEAEANPNIKEPTAGLRPHDPANPEQESDPRHVSRWGSVQYTRIEIALPSDLIWDLRQRSIREKTSLSEFVERALKDWKG